MYEDHSEDDSRVDQCLAIAGQVLGRAVRPGDGFFDLGGDSLKAIELIQRLEAYLGTEVDEADLLEAESLESFVRRTVGV